MNLALDTLRRFYRLAAIVVDDFRCPDQGNGGHDAECCYGTGWKTSDADEAEFLRHLTDTTNSAARLLKDEQDEVAS